MSRAAGADRMTSLLEGGLAPEVAKRWLKRHASNGTHASPTPAMCRGLLSVLLRASSKNDAWDALDALQAAQRMPISPLERLGFSATLVKELPAVLEDLLDSMLDQTPLLCPNPALTFYSTAGVGSTDEVEYDKPDELCVRAIAAKRVHAPTVGPVRAHNVTLMLDFFATAFNDMGRAKQSSPEQKFEPSPVLGSLPRAQVSNLWKRFYVSLPGQLWRLSVSQLRAVLAVFGGLVCCEPVTAQRDIAVELHTVFSKMCGTTASPALGLFARMLPVPNVRMASTLTCLLTFMRSRSGRALTAADVDKPMTISVYTQQLVVPLMRKTMDRRALLGVPALLSSFTEVWVATGASEQFSVELSAVAGIIDELKAALCRLEAQTGTVVQTDVVATRLSILAVCSRVMCARK